MEIRYEESKVELSTMDALYGSPCVSFQILSLSRKLYSLTSYRKLKQYDEARAIFLDVHKKKLDWPEAVWEAWISLEHLYGSVDDIDSCLEKVEKARVQVNFYRARVRSWSSPFFVLNAG